MASIAIWSEFGLLGKNATPGFSWGDFSQMVACTRFEQAADSEWAPVLDCLATV
jgi:hypothetical protein